MFPMSGALSQPTHQVLECDQHLKVARFRNHLGLCDSPFGNEVASELLSNWCRAAWLCSLFWS
eukprot:scaffold4826_cov80-Skeletonema_marinoi.AAC.1